MLPSDGRGLPMPRSVRDSARAPGGEPPGMLQEPILDPIPRGWPGRSKILALFRGSIGLLGGLMDSIGSYPLDRSQPKGRELGSVDIGDDTSERVTYSTVDGTQFTERFTVAGFDRIEITGSAGNDFLGGSSGDDILRGGPGNDALFGRGGNDTYIFAPGWGVDTITDPDPTGRLVFQGIEPNELAVENVNGNLVITRGADRITFNGYYTNTYNYDFASVEAPDPYNQGVLLRYTFDGDELQSEVIEAPSSLYGLRHTFTVISSSLHMTEKTIYELATRSELARAAEVVYDGGPLSLFLGSYAMSSCPDIRTTQGSADFNTYYNLEALVLHSD